MPDLSHPALLVLYAVFGLAALIIIYPPVLRIVWWVLLRAVYRLRIHHRDRIPASGPALIVANHACHIDWVLFWFACPRRVQMVMWSGYNRNPILRFLISRVKDRIVSIDNRSARPHAMVDALDAVAAALDRGEVVVLFPEGRVSRNGQMMPFHRGIERILKQVKTDVPIIPACTDHLWGTWFTYKPNVGLLQRVLSWRRTVSIWFGEPIHGKFKAPELRAKVVEMKADLAIHEAGELPSVFRGFLQTATRWSNVFRVGFVDIATGTERRLTFGQALVATWCLSGWLKRKFGPGAEPIGLWLPTGLGSTLANLAIGYLHRPTVNLNYTSGRDSVESAARQANLKFIVTSKRFLERMPLELPPDIERVYLEDALGAIPKPAKIVRMLAVLTLPAWLIARLIGMPRAATDDVQTIIFSSGSTGEPKGIMLTRKNIVANVDGFFRGVPIDRDDTMLATLPFFHSFGYTVCLWAAVYIGCRAVYYPDPRAAKEVGDLCRKHSCTVMMGTSTFLRFYMRRCGADDFKSVTLLICGAEKLPVKLAHEFRDKFSILPLEGYGCTETSPVVSVNLHDVEIRGVRQIANSPGTVGQPIPGVVAKAFHPETFEPLPHGEEGMLGVKGPNIMLGYWQQPEKTKHVVRDGWYMTGDIGLIEADGFIRITGRVSRFAKIAGEMIPLERVEHEMQELYGTGERIVTVCAVPDEKRGERLIVLYLPEAEAKLNDVLDGLAKAGLPNLWVPDRRHCILVESFPALGSGKLDLKAVGELAKTLSIT
jgi:acyl-[acyl-carrier-protein]-phospholipid O-acyltransferase / long-chain-fatty-acid--[acyl-carrier-protein] ligase